MSLSRSAAICLLLLFQGRYVQAGRPAWTMATAAYGIGAGTPADIALDKSGNLFVTGTFSGSLTLDTIVLHALVGTDIYLAKYTPAGQVIWARQFGGPGDEENPYLAVDVTGNPWVTGTFAGTLGFPGHSLTSLGSTDIYLAGYDGNGNLLHAKSYGSTYTDKAVEIAADGSGYIYLNGLYGDDDAARHDTISFDQHTLISPGAASVYLVKCGGDGSVVWARSGGHSSGASTIRSIGIGADGTGNVYMAGYFKGVAAFDSTMLPGDNLSSHKMFLLKYNSSGEVLWARQMKGNANMSGVIPDHLAVDPSGSCFIRGGIGSGMAWVNGGGGYGGGGSWQPVLTLFDFGGIQLASNQVPSPTFLARYTSGGNASWVKSTAGGYCSPMTVNTMITDAASNLYVAGWGHGFVAGGDTLPCYYTAYVARYDPAGAVQWLVAPGGPDGTGACYSLARSEQGDIFVTGNFTGKFDFGRDGDYYTSLWDGHGDMFLARLSPSATGIAALPEPSSPFYLFPNPASGQVQLQRIGTDAGRILVLNSVGCTVAAKDIPAGAKDACLQLKDLPAGCYYVQLQTAKERETRKLVMSH